MAYMRTRSARNPAVGTHPDLFEPAPTPVVVPMDELSIEQLAGLPRSAYSDDEWDELDDDLKEVIYENDVESKTRVQNMIDEFVQRHEAATAPDTDYVRQLLEDDFDYLFGELGQDGVGYIEGGRSRDAKDHVHGILDDFKENGYSEDQITEALNAALEDRDNWDFDYDTDEYTSAFFKASASESFYIDGDDLRVILEGMYEDEIERAIDEINSKTDLSVKPKDLQRTWTDGAGRKRLSEFHVDDYNTVYGDADPNWDKIEAAVKAALEDAEPEGQSGLDESRIIYRFDDGSFVYDLLASELPAEGRGRGLCVGSKQYDFIDSVEAGTNKIFSMRDPDGRRVFTIQAIMKPSGSEIGYIGQVKGDNNRLPSAAELDWVLEFLNDGLGIPMKKLKDVRDLKPAMREKGIIKEKPVKNPEEESYHCGFCRLATF